VLQHSLPVQAGEVSVIEDPQPLLLKELIMVNPIALVGCDAQTFFGPKNGGLMVV
jgi:hypothetical protein